MKSRVSPATRAALMLVAEIEESAQNPQRMGSLLVEFANVYREVPEIERLLVLSFVDSRLQNMLGMGHGNEPIPAVFGNSPEPSDFVD